MKKISPKVTICITVILLIFGFSTWAMTNWRTESEPKINWKVPTENFIGDKTLMTYRAVPVKPINQEQAQKMVEQLRETAGIRIQFDKVQEYDGRFIFTSSEDSSAVFDVASSTGTFLFNSGLKNYSKEGSTRDLPSQKNAPELAYKYLDKLHYLPENKQEMNLARVGGLSMAAAKEGKTSEKYEKLVTVYFRRILGGMDVRGRGSRILVQLGEQSSLVGVIRSWAEVKDQKHSRNQVKNDKLIFQEIRRRLIQMAGQAEEIVVQKAKLVLFDDGRGVIEPAIHVVAAARYQGPNKDRSVIEIPVDFYIPALLKPEGYYPFHQDAEAKWPGSDKTG